MHRLISIRRVLQLALTVGFVSAVICENVHAHSMNLFAGVEGGAVRGQVFGRGGTPFVGVTVTAYAPDGETLGETRTNDTGEFSLVATKRCDWRLVAVTGDGHQAEYTVPAEELPSDLPSGGKPAKSPTPAAKVQVPTPALPESRPVLSAPATDGTAELGRQVAALRRELNQLREELRWQDILGGIGYILGLMGLAFYFLGVQKRDRARTLANSHSQPVTSADAADAGDPAETGI